MTRVLVIGDACIDVFVYGKCNRLCPEAPVPVFTPEKTETNDGMALNVARNIRSLGTDCVAITNDKTAIRKQRYVESSLNHMILRVDKEDEVIPLNLSSIPDDAWRCDIAVVSDYNKGYLTEQMMCEISKRFSISFLDTKKRIGSWANGFSYIKLNEMEYKETINTITESLHQKLIVTLGKRGCSFQNKMFSPPTVTNTVNVCGAGDTFLAGLVVEYLSSNSIESAIQHALRCASNVVQKRGVSVPDTHITKA